MLARRGDHENTWTWLWSASELGLGDTVDLDVARDLLSICRIARRYGWVNVLRVAGKLARQQFEHLELGEQVLEVERHMAEVNR